MVALGWSAEEELLCVQEDGAVLVYGFHGDFRRHFSMGNVGATGACGGKGDLLAYGLLNPWFILLGSASEPCPGCPDFSH